MALTDDLRDWIARVDGALDPDDLPRIDTPPRELPDAFQVAAAQFSEHTDADDIALDSVAEAAEAIIRHDAWNATPRFLLLYIHYWMFWWSLPDHPDPNHPDGDPAPAENRERIFRRLVALVSPRDVPPSWSVIRWEIAASYLAGAWHRAFRLYDHADATAVRDNRDIALIRGSFRYLLAREGRYPAHASESSIAWEPRVLGSNEPFIRPRDMPLADLDQAAGSALYAEAVKGGWITARWGFPKKRIDSDDSFFDFSSFQRARAEMDAERIPDAIEDFELLERKEFLYLDARNDLDKGIRAYDGKASIVYDALRARCELELGNHAGASHLYHRLLAERVHRGLTFTDRRVSSPTAGKERPVRAELFLTTAKCYRAADNADAAFQVLDQGLKEFPDDRSLLLERAELAAQEARPLEALDSYRQALVGIPEEDWGLPARLASILGDAFVETKDFRTVIERAAQEDCERTDLIAELVSTYWRPFTDLTTGARDSWLMGLYQLSILPRIDSRLRLPLLEGAVLAFSKAVERELRERIFLPAQAALGTAAQSWAGAPDDPRQPEHRFILFARGKTKLTLGAMYRILVAAQKSHIGLSSDLRSWLRAKTPRWEMLLAPLHEIAEERNPAAHGESDREADVKRAHAACRRCLEILTGRE